MDVFGGYGPNTAIVNNHRVLFHNGGIVGQSTFVEHYPDLDLTAVVLGNSDAPGTSPIVHFAREVITAEPSRRREGPWIHTERDDESSQSAHLLGRSS